MVLTSGAGTTTMVFLSTPISTRVCRVRSCNASGWATITSEAAPAGRQPGPHLGGDDLGPLLAFGLSLAGHGPLHGLGQLDVLELDQGHDHPHSSVATSRISRMTWLMRSVSARISSRVCWPITLRRVVWAIWLMAAATFSIATTDLTGLMTR